MDKTVDSGSTDMGSIPIRGIIFRNISVLSDAGVSIFQNFSFRFRVS